MKMPRSGVSMDQKRKKASYERDLEYMESRIDEIKNKLRKWDALALK